MHAKRTLRVTERKERAAHKQQNLKNSEGQQNVNTKNLQGKLARLEKKFVHTKNMQRLVYDIYNDTKKKQNNLFISWHVPRMKQIFNRGMEK